MLVHQPQFVFVAIVHYHQWPKVMLRSLREHFREEIILVNHLPNGEEIPTNYQDEHCTILQNPDINKRGHGAGIDVAVEFLKRRGDKFFIHIEPDCLFTGKDWAVKLLDAAHSGAIMAGPCKLPFGPIHPCPSIWDLDRIPGSFGFSPRTEGIDFKLFNYQQMVRWLCDTGMSDGGIWLWCHLWDCGIKNWYEAAKLNLAVHTDTMSGIRHFWAGRLRSPWSLPPSDLSLVEKYLN